MSSIENVVIVLVDALRADRVGCVDGSSELTPHIDSLAADGTTFRNAFGCSSNTDPSVTSLLTGRYPLHSILHHGKLVTDAEKRRVESIPALPALLSGAGWETAAVGQPLGRWHARGFDSYPRTGMEDRFRSGLFSLARRGFDWLDALASPLATRIRRLYNLRNVGFKPDVVMQDFDPTNLLTLTSGTPFFGFVHLMDTHMPYLAPTETFEEVATNGDYPTMAVETFLDGEDVTEAQAARLRDAVDTLGLEHLGELLALYDSAVRYADHKVGRLVESLERAGRLEQTALFVTADHGESLLEHGIFIDHHGLHDEVFHVPLVTNLGDGTRIDELVQLTDLAPTVLDMLSVDGPPMDGRSLVPLIDGTDGWQPREAVYAEEAYTERRVGIRTTEWKYVRHEDDPVIESERGSSLVCGYCETVHGDEQVVFDLGGDPEEQANVASDHPEVVSALESGYEAFVNDLLEPDASEDNVRYDHEEDVLDRLEAIGYR